MADLRCRAETELALHVFESFTGVGEPLQMRQEVGWTAAIAAVIAAAIGVTSPHGERSSSGQRAPAQMASQQDRTGPATERDISLGPCAQLESHLKSFLGIDGPGSTVVPESCFDQSHGDAPRSAKESAPGGQEGTAKNQPQSQPIHLNFMIATLPDPTHTHFPLEFDRMSEAIQQGASDEGYVYDSSWLPWVTTDSTFSSLKDQDAADARKEAQEGQPGILLFRRKPSMGPTESGTASANLPYQDGLVVFIVGEEPTQGIHRDQFRNATAWIAALQANDANKRRLPPIILGPSFSGSVYSLAALVSDPQVAHNLASGQASDDERLRIYSGNITGNKAMAWIINVLGARADFASFQHSDGFLISRYCEYLRHSNFDLSRFAILSEDQTAYGGEVTRPGVDTANTAAEDWDSGSIEAPDADLSSCHLDPLANDATGINGDQSFQRPLRVFYPRDISALRAAYQSESIFSTSSSSDAAQRTLAPDIADPQGNQHDSIRAYSGDQKALSQEAILQQIVSELRIHQSQYILLRSSNVLDQIFLSHYLRLAYPQGRIVILGADQMLRRESGAARLSGIMTLTTYPLLPWEPHWTQRLDDPSAHSHRVFAQDRSEGVYVAARALLHFPVVLQKGQACGEIVDHLLAAKFTIKPAAGDAGGDPKCRCKPAGSVVPVSIQAQKTNTRLDLTFAFESGSGQYLLHSIRQDAGKKQEARNTNLESDSDQSSETSGYALPVPSLKGFVPVTSELKIPDYRAPFWVDGPAINQDGPEAPTAWLSVLGRNDFWPLAALTADSIGKESLDDQPAQRPPHSLWRAFRSLFNVFNPHEYGGTSSNSHGGNGVAADSKNKRCATSVPRWLPMPVGVRMVLAAFLVGCCFHFLCCAYPSVTQKPSHRAYFVSVGRNRLPYLALMVLGCVTISATATVLACGFGAMSPDGVPYADPGFWLLSQPFFWSFAGLALAINVSKQPFVSQTGRKEAAGLLGARGSAGHTGKMKWRSAKDYAQKWRVLSGSIAAFALGTLAFYFFAYFTTERILTVASRVPAYWRSMDFTDGVSPVMPLVAIAVGVYLWFWYSLQGLALLGSDRPRLPSAKSLTFENHAPRHERKVGLKSLGLFSRQIAAAPVEELCSPFAPKVLKRAALFFVLQILLVFVLGFRFSFYTIEIPLRSLGARSYSILICLLMDLLFSIMMANAWQLVNVWRELRKLLTHLDRLPLRRSMAAFPGVSWNSVWTISGNVLDMRYKFLTNELRCVTYLNNCLAAQGHASLFPRPSAGVKMSSSIAEIEKAQGAFALWYSDLYNKSEDLNQKPVEAVQKMLADFAGFLMTGILVPAWREEKGDEISAKIAGDVAFNPEKQLEELTPVSQLASHVRLAEQLVCYVYLGFIQNVLGRMRSLVMCILLLFIAATIAMASYPFDPRPSISGTMVLLFGVLTTAIVFVYAQVHRDPILSLVTNTKPGELGGDFWLKLLGFGTGPVLGLLTALFPQVTDFLFSWVQPNLSSIK